MTLMNSCAVQSAQVDLIVRSAIPFVREIRHRISEQMFPNEFEQFALDNLAELVILNHDSIRMCDPLIFGTEEIFTLLFLIAHVRRKDKRRRELGEGCTRINQVTELKSHLSLILTQQQHLDHVHVSRPTEGKHAYMFRIQMEPWATHIPEAMLQIRDQDALDRLLNVFK